MPEMLSVEDLRARFAAKEVFSCRVAGCNTFPFESEGERDAHEATPHAIASGRFESVPNGFGGRTTRPAASFRRGPEASAEAGGVRPAREGAIQYLRDLVAKKRPQTDPAYVESLIAQGAARVSKAIDNLKALPDVAAAPSAPRVRVNQYPGKCESCGKRVGAEAGRLSRADDGSWQVWHLDGECPAFELGVADGRYAVENAEGVLRFYHLTDGQVFVMASDAEHLVPGPAARAIVDKIKADPLAASVAYGREWRQCGRCGRGLSNEDSRKAGIGPICATKGWF